MSRVSCCFWLTSYLHITYLRVFYRASARTACRTRYCFTTAFRPSVRPSNAGIVYKPMHIFHTFWRPGRGIILVFKPHYYNCCYKIPILSGGIKYPGWAIFAIFDRNRRLSRKRYNGRPINPCYGFNFQWHWVTLKGGTRWAKIFWRISVITVVHDYIWRGNRCIGGTSFFQPCPPT